MSTAARPALRNPMEEALSLHSAGRYQEALDALSTPGESLPDFYTLRGDIQFALERYEEAAGSYFTSATLEPAPQNAYAQFRLGICLHHLGRWAEAGQAFQRVLEMDPHRDEVRLGLGACLLHLNRPEEALANFDHCWSDAARLRVLFGKAVALQLLGRRQEAESAYQRLLAADPRSAEALSNLIALSMEAHDLENARRYAVRLADLDPESLPALQCLAAVALENREYEAAVRYCSRIVERDPDCVEAWHNLRFASGRIMSTLRPPAVAAASAAGRK
ncbi:MAG TPA: tetratricopeptide repeat protein [Bryobacteraceae bacterium]|nr:tetratricopeptide repeat protein [Bryobacteraceae bacterium]